MATEDPELHEAAEKIKAAGREWLPQVKTALGVIEEWDAESLVHRHRIFMSHCRDTVLRVVGMDVPPSVRMGLDWWRREVDERLDPMVRRLSRVPELARLLLARDDAEGVTYLVLLETALALVERERQRRFDATTVGRLLRRIFLDDPVEDRGVLDELLVALRPGSARKADDIRSDVITAVFAFYENVGQRMVKADVAAYRDVALGPLSSLRVLGIPEWTEVAGALLIEDIQDARRYMLPLLTEGADEQARGAVRDARREAYRATLAEKRGGPGFSWQCDCGTKFMRKVLSCPDCGKQRPRWLEHVTLEEAVASEEPSPEERASVLHFLDLVVKERYGSSRSYQAFRQLALGDARSRREAAGEQKIDPSTLKEFIEKIRRDFF
jgi:hypothetical protein